MAKKVIILFIICGAYAVLRYNVFGPKSPENIPLYIANKAVSMGSVLALLLAAISYYREIPAMSRFWGKISLHSAFLHILMSFPLITPAYYPVFFGFVEGVAKMNHVGELVMLFGVLGAYFYYLILRSEPGSEAMRRFKIIASFFVAAHIFEMGAGGWLNVQGWHGGMPPITLITTLAAGLAMVLVYLRPAPVKG
jgi:hypothetical protein